jgi:[ribosomal protein S5]-alanine N-acetyltransferase
MSGRGIDIVTTARLVGRRPEPGDADAYVRMYGDPRTPEEWWPSNLRSPDHARATLAKFIDHWQRWGFGLWTVLLPDGEVVGHAGAQYTTVDGRRQVELGWFIDPGHWRQGYATEMAREAVRVAFDVLGLDDVVAFTVDRNAASRAVMEKLGMTYVRDIEHAGLPHVLYRLGRGVSQPVAGAGETPA